MEKIRIIIFDCDGVVINSGADIAAAVNAMLDHFNLHRLSEEKLISYTGDGASKLILRALNSSAEFGGFSVRNISPETMSSYLNWYLDYYYEHCIIRTVLYPGIAVLLERLSLAGIHVALVSNKPENISHRILEYFDIADYFDAVIGPNQLKHMKPNPEGLQLATDKINKIIGIGGKKEDTVSPCQVLMVGDSDVDIQAGHAFKCHTCAVTGGIGNKERLAAEHADITVKYAGDLRGLLAL
ncbi:MAG: HAD hydrolase-like protein [Treponema sp.]|jgi:phosphoglycolate phosphatase|nr:HAD hydrolase-like protein [Treponema sp.]